MRILNVCIGLFEQCWEESSFQTNETENVGRAAAEGFSRRRRAPTGSGQRGARRQGALAPLHEKGRSLDQEYSIGRRMCRDEYLVKQSFSASSKAAESQ